MAFDLNNRVVLITGGSNGIGAKVIEFLLDENVKHIGNLDVAEDIGIAQQTKLNDKYGANKVKFYKCDVSKEDQLLGSYQSILDEHGYIDIVINNAGIMNDSKEKYKKEIEINFLALTTSTLKAMDIMNKSEGGKGGVVINISSIAALYQDELLPIYYGTKSAVLQFSNCIGHIGNLDVAEDIGIAQQTKLNDKYGANKVKFYKCDVSKEDQLLGSYQSILDEHGYIDIVINNAGIMNDSKEKYKKEIEINFLALTTSTLKAMDIMNKSEGGKGGVVINISSIAALYQDELLPIYYGTKSAVLQFSNCIGLPRYFTRSGVRVITMCFGATDTALLTKNMLGNFDKNIDNQLMNILKAHPMQKVESAAGSLVEVLKRGESGSTWLSISNKPVQDITPVIKKAYGILTELIF